MQKLRKYATLFILCFVGGFFNAYSFYMRGGRFAFLQTGTLIAIIYDLFSGNWSDLWLGLTTFFSFYLGIVLAFFLEYSFKKIKREKYLRFCILCLCCILLVPCLFFEKTMGVDWSFISIFFVGIMGGIILEYFKDFTSTMMTNNTKLFTSCLCEKAIKTKGLEHKASFYTGLILSFCVGVVSFFLFYFYTSAVRYSIFVPCGLLLGLAILELGFLKKPQFIIDNFPKCYISDDYLNEEQEIILNHIILYSDIEPKKYNLDSKIIEAAVLLKEENLAEIRRNSLAHKLYMYHLIEENKFEEIKLFLNQK